MSDDRVPDERPRPTPRARPTAPRPSPGPRARVAGSRRDREDAGEPSARPATAELPATAGSDATAGTARRRLPAALLVLALLCVAAAAGGGVLLRQRLNPTHVDPEILAAARSGIQAVYAYDYEDSEGSVQGKLDALTGDLRDQYEQDLTDGGIISSYEQVSATTRYEVLDVGVQQVDDSQESATVVVFGQYVLKSVNSGTQPAPEGSECQVTPDGAQSCVQTVRATLVDVDGDWKISELTVLTTS